MPLNQEQLTEFVTMWQIHTVQEIAVEFGITPRDATRIAHDLRINGVLLRDQRRKRVNYEALARVAQEAGRCS